jgi:hypothetical protein
MAAAVPTQNLQDLVDRRLMGDSRHVLQAPRESDIAGVGALFIGDGVMGSVPQTGRPNSRPRIERRWNEATPGALPPHEPSARAESG